MKAKIWKPKRESIFSKRSLVFVILFASIGTFILIQTFAAPSSHQPDFLKKRKPDSAAKIEEYKLLVEQGNKNVDILTRTIKHGHPHDKTKTHGQLVKLSKDRISNLTALLDDDPDAVLKLVLSDKQIADARSLPSVETEKKVSLTAYYGVDHYHDWKSGYEYTVPFVTPDGYTKYPLYFTDDTKVPTTEANRQIKVTGYQIGDKILATGITKDKLVAKSNPLINLVGKAEAASGNYNVAVIVANPSDVTNTIDMTKVQSLFNGSAGSDINSYFKEISYGRYNLVPSFFGPYQVPVTKSSGCSNNFPNSTFNNAMYNLANADINYLNFPRVIVIDGCGGGGGVASWSSAPSSTPDGSIVRAYISIGGNSYTDKEMYTHELSHVIGFDKPAFGNSHAGRYICIPAIFTPPSLYGNNCDSGEYEDEFDVLGSKERYSNNIAGETDTLHKDAEPFFNTGENVALSAPGTYSYKIGPFEDPASAIKALTISRGNSGTSFSVEYRQATGFDSFLSDSLRCPNCNITLGASIRFNFDTQGTGGGSDTQLLDATPGSLNTNLYRPSIKDWNDSAFLPGQTFTDPEYGISITVGTPDASGLPITVTIPAQTCTHNKPTVNAPTTIPGNGTPFQYTLTITNADTSGCQNNSFKVFTDGIGGYAIASPDNLTLAPGASQTVTVNVTPSTQYADNYYSSSWSVISNSLGNTVTQGSFIYQLSTAADTTAPSVPGNFKVDVKGSSVNTLSWTGSSDNLGVAGYSIYRDGINIDATPNSYYVDTTAQPSTTYSYYIQAYDHKNNKSASTSTITVSNPAKSDSTFPSVPLANATVSDAHTVNLSWTASTDAGTGVAYYIVAGTNGSIPSLSPSITSQSYKGLRSSEKYDMYVQAIDGDGNRSTPNPEPGTAHIMTSKPGTLPPTNPANFNAVEVSGNRNVLWWDSSSDDKSVTGYKIYVCDSGSLNSCGGYVYSTVTVPSAVVMTPQKSQNYFYWTQALDGDGNSSGISTKIFAYLSGSWPLSDATPPTVSLISPSSGATVSGKINVTYSATDNNQVTGSVLYVDGNIVGAINTNSTPATGPIELDTAKLSNGSHTLNVKSYDYFDNSATSSSITINVQNGSTDTTPPTVSLTSPANGSTVSGSSVFLVANATDNVGVTKVEFLVDGTVVNSDISSPYSFSWNSTSLPNGSHTITAKAYDAAGNITTSSSVTIAVNNSVQGDVNNDGTVNILDLSVVALHWNQTGQTLSTGDINGDGTVNILDLSILATNFGT